MRPRFQIGRRSWAALFVVGALALCAIPACTVSQPDDAKGPGGIYINNTNINQIGQQPNPSPSGSPNPGAVVVTRVGIGQFGEGECPAGKEPSGNGRSMSVRIGCTGAFTCSPYDAAGKEIMDDASIAAIGPPQRFEAISGTRLVQQIATSEPYNLDLKGIAAGDVELECVVKGVSSKGNRQFIVHIVP